ncbi:DUF2075 domain-containing protein [bacterium]|nr:DUF2075 domain-containing protein [bacterium]
MIDYLESSFWAGTIDDFIGQGQEALVKKLLEGHLNHCNEQAAGSQVKAWEDSIETLAVVLKGLPGDLGVIFEYILPREGGRRPDVLLITTDFILVLEFKGFGVVRSAHVDQAEAYARDLVDYQSCCRGKRVVPFLVLTQAMGERSVRGGVQIHSPDTLAPALQDLVRNCSGGSTSLVEFLKAEYSPLPSIVAAAQSLFKHEPLPHIKRAESAGIPETVKNLHKLADEASSEGKNILALVTGVPGSGKTLVGLQFAYDRSSSEQSEAVFLSGNGPLVEVLQYALGTKVFVQSVHGFLKEYGGVTKRAPRESIWIYDEAQRAWDDQRAQQGRGAHAVSEPKDFVRLGGRVEGGSLIVGLIGEGQEIHIGEEAGITQWNDAIEWDGSEWTVACPQHLGAVFLNATELRLEDGLNLSQSLRTHRALDLQGWVNSVLQGEIANAKALSEKLAADHYPIYVTRLLRSAKLYVQHKYMGFEDKRYGLLASSKAQNLARHGVPNDFQSTKRVRKGPWYSDSPSSRKSCCQLTEVVTEFGCQGLELDFPVVAWGDDLLWGANQGRWDSQYGGNKAVDPHQLRINSYRVLLTRGRDGMVIYVPEEPRMDQTAAVLVQAGALEFVPVKK